MLIVGCGPAGLTLAAQLVGVSRHQDLHRRAEAGPAAARAGRRHRLPHHGDVQRLRLRRTRAAGGLLGQRDDVLEAGRAASPTTSCAAAAFRTSRTGCRKCRMSSSTRRACMTAIWTSCASRRPARAALRRGVCSTSRSTGRAVRRSRRDRPARTRRCGARGRGRDDQGALRRRLRRRAQHGAQVDRPRAARRFRQPRLGRDGRPGRHRLSRHPLQVADPVGAGRQHPRSSRARAAIWSGSMSSSTSSTPASGSPAATSRPTI